MREGEEERERWQAAGRLTMFALQQKQEAKQQTEVHYAVHRAAAMAAFHLLAQYSKLQIAMEEEEEEGEEWRGQCNMLLG